MNSQGYRVAVVGATGAVGREMLRMLEERQFPVSECIPVASARSAGSTVHAFGQDLVVRELNDTVFEGVDVALFSAGGDRSKQYGPIAAAAGAVVIDNSSAWRMHADVPLVVPEVNGDLLDARHGIIANPNCSTIQMVLALQALHEAAGLSRVVVSTYQSTAGAGQGGIDELLVQTRAHLAGETVAPKVFPRSIAFDCIPQIGSFSENGYSVEEEKMIHETRKIMRLPDLAVSATCVRVPVMRGHLESVTVDLQRPLSAADAKRALAAFPGLTLVDDPAAGVYPTAVDCTGRIDTLVGRVREDISLPATLHLWIASDNLLKGAAWNAVQIAEALHAKGTLRAG
jgi:aspartate-semialdehyde dehydrogenase